MDTPQWPEGIKVVKSMEAEKKEIKPQKPPSLNCPRCNSTHTKFCYYNNYSLSQPRYFCKTCRRYWTEGGSLRNVPVGGGSRKNNKRSSSSISSLANPPKNKLPDHNLIVGQPSNFSQNPNGQDLNLAYPPPGNYSTSTHNVSNFPDLPYNHPNTTLEFLKSGIANSRGIMNSFMSTPMPMPMPVSDSNSMIYSSAGLPFSLDGFESGYNNGSSLQGGVVHQDTTNTSAARLFFPLEDLKPVSATSTDQELQQNRGRGDSNGYWNNGGSW